MQKRVYVGQEIRKNTLVLVGNGFDLAHGLKTGYKDFLNWYVCHCFDDFCKNHSYSDLLIQITNKYTNTRSAFLKKPNTIDEVLDILAGNDYQSLKFNSIFFRNLVAVLNANNWVDIERFYFQTLKKYFLDRSTDQRKNVCTLNKEFDALIQHLSHYVRTVNGRIDDIPEIDVSPESSFCKIFRKNAIRPDFKFLNFNYTETLRNKYRFHPDEIIHIHGRATDLENNPIIFGYGDESDPDYQGMEDTGENMYLEHIKSFGYFKTDEYARLLSFIDSDPYQVYIVGHSCGLSDRVLLNEIFEHLNCCEIEIMYHQRPNGSDNFQEITQEMSRHFKPSSKKLMRRNVMSKNAINIIPQVYLH